MQAVLKGLRSRPGLTVIFASLLFALMKSVLDAGIGFSYGDSSRVAIVIHDVGMMCWGATLVALVRRTNSNSK